MFGVPVVTNSCVFYSTHEAAGAACIRCSLRPLFSEGDSCSKTRAQITPRDRSSLSFGCLTFEKTTSRR